MEVSAQPLDERIIPVEDASRLSRPGEGKGARRPQRGVHLQRGSQRRRDRIAPWVLVTAVYVLLAMISNLPAWLHGFTHEIQGGGTGDPAEEVWFLALTPYSIIHGHNPFLTRYINYPYGANLMVNTTMFLPGLLLAPITLLWGAVASFNVLMVMSIALSATAAYTLFRRWTSWRPAAFVGGLLYGFSPYMVGAAGGHFFLLFAPFPPLTLLVLDNVMVRQRGRPVLWGTGLGLLLSAQLLTSTEVFASTGIIAACGLLLLLIFRWREVPRHLPYALRALTSGAATFVAICGYPVWLILAGPQHLTGLIAPLQAQARFSADLLGAILPTTNEAIAPSTFQHLANTFVGYDGSENSTYIGIPLLLVLAAITVWCRKQSVVRFAAAMAIIAFLFNLGPNLRIDGHVTSVPLPFGLVSRLPLYGNSIPARYSVYTFLFAGLLLAVGLDRVRRHAARTRHSTVNLGLCVLLSLFCLVPLIPRWPTPYPITNVAVPTFFRTSAVRSIPRGSVLLPYPFPNSNYDESMVWQAEDEFRYNLPAGYVLTPGPHGSTVPDGLPSTVGTLLADAYTGTPMPTLSHGVLCAIGADLRTWNVRSIVVTTSGPNPQIVLALFDAALANRPLEIDGSYVYRNVQDQLRSQQTLSCPPLPGLP